MGPVEKAARPLRVARLFLWSFRIAETPRSGKTIPGLEPEGPRSECGEKVPWMAPVETEGGLEC